MSFGEAFVLGMGAMLGSAFMLLLLIVLVCVVIGIIVVAIVRQVNKVDEGEKLNDIDRYQ